MASQGGGGAYDIGFADSNAGALSSAFVFNGGKGKGNVDFGGLVMAAVLIALGILGYLTFKKEK